MNERQYLQGVGREMSSPQERYIFMVITVIPSPGGLVTQRHVLCSDLISPY
jgi:hypothetical protein